MTQEKREIRRKLRVLEHAERIGSVSKTLKVSSSFADFAARIMPDPDKIAQMSPFTGLLR